MKFLTTTAAFFLAAMLHAQVGEHNILYRDSFPSFVKSATRTGYLAGTEQKDTPLETVYYEFDSTGHWSVRIESRGDEVVSNDSAFYDPVKRTRVIRQHNAVEPATIVFTYNTDGTVKRMSMEPAMREHESFEYEYDGQKRVVKSTHFFPDQRIEEVYTFDKEGRQSGMKRYSGSRISKKLPLDYEEQFVYEQESRSYVQYNLYYGAGDKVTMRDTIFFTFDERNLLTSKTESLENGTSKKIVLYAYDDKGRVVSEQTERRSTKSDVIKRWNVTVEYDTLGNWAYYSEEGDSYGYSNRWTTVYNARGLPEHSAFETMAETIYYRWEYEYRK